MSQIKLIQLRLLQRLAFNWKKVKNALQKWTWSIHIHIQCEVIFFIWKSKTWYQLFAHLINKTRYLKEYWFWVTFKIRLWKKQSKKDLDNDTKIFLQRKVWILWKEGGGCINSKKYLLKSINHFEEEKNFYETLVFVYSN